MKRIRAIAVIWLSVVLFVSSCAPAKTPVDNLKDAFSVTFEYAVNSDSLEGDLTKVVDVTSNYDVTNSTPRWVSASFLYMALVEGGGANFLDVTIDTAGNISEIALEPGSMSSFAGPGLFRSDVQFYLGDAFVEQILTRAWEKFGSYIDANCGPVTNIKYRAVAAESSPMDVVANFTVTYNGKQSIVFRSVDDIADMDIACP